MLIRRPPEKQKNMMKKKKQSKKKKKKKENNKKERPNLIIPIGLHEPMDRGRPLPSLPKKKEKEITKKKTKSIFSSERRTKASPVYGGRRIPRRIAASNENILEQAKWRSEIVMESPMEDDWWPMGWVVVVGVVVVGFSR